MSGDIVVRFRRGDGWQAAVGGRAFPCAIGQGGISRAKREGDGCTPLGRFALRGLFFRPDRGLVPETGLALWPLTPRSGWCDGPCDPAYNRLVPLPWRSSAESLWRADSLYDLIVPLGFNDEPVSAGAGSAIFLHVARPGLTPTAGCVALRREDLIQVLAEVGPDWHLSVEAPL